MNQVNFVNLPPNLLQQLITLLVFRLGGQQTFTPEEIKEIQQMVGGVTMAIDKDYKITLKVRTRASLRESLGSLPEPEEQEQEEDEA